MTCGFLIQLVFCKKKNCVVYWCWSGARDECTPPKKNPGSAPVMRIRHLSCPSKATKRLLKTPHVEEYCGHVFYKWPLNAVLHKKLSLQSFRRKYCKDGAKTYDFIADKCCLLFSIILKVLHGWEVIRTQGKILCWANLTRPKGNFWSLIVCTRL